MIIMMLLYMTLLRNDTLCFAWTSILKKYICSSFVNPPLFIANEDSCYSLFQSRASTCRWPFNWWNIHFLNSLLNDGLYTFTLHVATARMICKKSIVLMGKMVWFDISLTGLVHEKTLKSSELNSSEFLRSIDVLKSL